METNDVVVGVDGSAGSWQALHWATAEARRRGGRLRVVAAYSPSWSLEQWPGMGERLGTELGRAEVTVAEMVAVARSTAPDLVVTGLSVNGPPVPVLMAAVTDGALLVVGNRGHGGFASLLLGTTGLHLATRAADRSWWCAAIPTVRDRSSSVRMAHPQPMRPSRWPSARPPITAVQCGRCAPTTFPCRGGASASIHWISIWKDCKGWSQCHFSSRSTRGVRSTRTCRFRRR
jgi:nucleotide-binding universal stress UspA family protein